jgi:hypothetical protein
MHLLYALVTGVAAAYCLLAIWVAIGRGHWFARACVLLAALALLVPIRAYEPLILFGMAAVMLIGGWGTWRLVSAATANSESSAPSETSRYRFRLSDLLLACVVAGGVSWLVSVLVARELIVSWWRFALAALMLALMSSLAVAVVRGPRRWISIPLVLVATLGAVALDHYVLKNYLYADELLIIYRDAIFSSRQGLNQIATLYSLFAAWTLLVTAAGTAWSHPYRKGQQRYVARGLIAAAVAPCFVLTGSVYWHMLGAPAPPVANASEENNLPGILELSRQLAGASPKEAEAIFAELLPLLKRPARVSIDWSGLGSDHDELNRYLADIQTMRAVARQMDAECQRLRTAGHPDEAGDLALAVIRCGNSYRRDGMLIHFLVGEGIAGIGHRCLAQCRADLSRAKALEAAHLLQSISAGDERVDELLARDALWENLALTWRHTLSQAVHFKIWGNIPGEGMEGMLQDAIDRDGCKSDLLMTDLALRAYLSDQGALPAKLDDLSPQYLDRIPADRYSGRPLVYRRAEEGFVLYSAGKDGRDDGGKFGNNTTYFASPGYDYDVDTMIRP